MASEAQGLALLKGGDLDALGVETALPSGDATNAQAQISAGTEAAPLIQGQTADTSEQRPPPPEGGACCSFFLSAINGGESR